MTCRRTPRENSKVDRASLQIYGPLGRPQRRVKEPRINMLKWKWERLGGSGPLWQEQVLRALLNENLAGPG